MRTLIERQMLDARTVMLLVLGRLDPPMTMSTTTSTVCKLCDSLQSWGRTTRDAEQFSGPLQRGKAYPRIMTLTRWRVVELRVTCSSEFPPTYEVRYRTLG